MVTFREIFFRQTKHLRPSPDPLGCSTSTRVFSAGWDIHIFHVKNVAKPSEMMFWHQECILGTKYNISNTPNIVKLSFCDSPRFWSEISQKLSGHTCDNFINDFNGFWWYFDDIVIPCHMQPLPREARMADCIGFYFNEALFTWSLCFFTNF